MFGVKMTALRKKFVIDKLWSYDLMSINISKTLTNYSILLVHYYNMVFSIFDLGALYVCVLVWIFNTPLVAVLGSNMQKYFLGEEGKEIRKKM